jgi:tetratricopeptide (TPR) repeat protein
VDGEFMTIMGGGLVFILAAVGALIWQRKKQSEEAGGGAIKPKKARPSRRRPPPKKAQPPEEKKSILSALRVGGSKTGIEKEKSGPSKKDIDELEDLIKADHVDEAARLAMRLELWDKAAQLYLKVEQPANAAHCAKRAGKLEMAAEFYEKAGEIPSAVRMWEKAGNFDRARQLAGDKSDDDDDEAIIQISKELQKEIDAAIEKKDHVRASELYEQAGDRENAAEQFAIFAQTARRPEMYAKKVEELSKRVAYNMLRIATKGRPPEASSAELYRRLAALQHHFGNRPAAVATLEKLLKVVPEDEEASQMLEELADMPPDSDDDVSEADEAAVLSPPAPEVAEPEAGGTASAEVEAAVATIKELVAMIGKQPCDLGNIEVYYRLGLACLAAEKRDDARNAFRAVDQTSPGYRDTEQHLADLG